MKYKDFTRKYKDLGKATFHCVNEHLTEVTLTSYPKIDISILSPYILEDTLDNLPEIVKTAVLGLDPSSAEYVKIGMTEGPTFNDMNISIESCMIIDYKTLIVGGRIIKKICLTQTKRGTDASKSYIRSVLSYEFSKNKTKINTGGYLSCIGDGKYQYSRDAGISNLDDFGRLIDRELLYLDLIINTINEINEWGN